MCVTVRPAKTQVEPQAEQPKDRLTMVENCCNRAQQIRLAYAFVAQTFLRKHKNPNPAVQTQSLKLYGSSDVCCRCVLAAELKSAPYRHPKQRKQGRQGAPYIEVSETLPQSWFEFQADTVTSRYRDGDYRGALAQYRQALDPGCQPEQSCLYFARTVFLPQRTKSRQWTCWTGRTERV